ncbi:MAG: DUF2807 domain-containing protein [Bacteroidales bacterium]|nr:DUF2807 domain-containing protein [Bacteroidales bacterium]
MKKILLFALLVMTVLTGCANRNGAKIRGHNNNSHNVIVNGDAISIGGKGTVIGSGRFVTKDIAVGDFSYIQLSGTPNVNFTQKSGSGNIRAQNFIAKNVDARTSGSGSIDCYASDNIKTSSKGSGRIRYYGNPRVN